jgi:hypothetical protein
MSVEYRPSVMFNTVEEFTIIDSSIEIYVSLIRIVDLLGIRVIIKKNNNSSSRILPLIGKLHILFLRVDIR